jgi:hypothetical protein
MASAVPKVAFFLNCHSSRSEDAALAAFARTSFRYIGPATPRRSRSEALLQTTRGTYIASGICHWCMPGRWRHPATANGSGKQVPPARGNDLDRIPNQSPQQWGPAGQHDPCGRLRPIAADAIVRTGSRHRIQARYQIGAGQAVDALFRIARRNAGRHRRQHPS